MKLEELQRRVQRHILEGGEPEAPLCAAIGPPARERLEIYVDAYRLRLIAGLGVQYPAFAARCGRERFADHMNAFITAFPSRHRSIRDYGGELGAHVGHDAQDAETSMLAELADFEWRLTAAFDAPDAIPTAPTELAHVRPEDWPDLRFKGVPSLQRLATHSNAVSVWRAAKASLESADAASAMTDPVAVTGACVDWLIWRREHTTEFRSVPADEARALDALLAGDSFGSVCEALTATEGDRAALQAATWLKGWLVEGLLEQV